MFFEDSEPTVFREAHKVQSPAASSLLFILRCSVCRVLGEGSDVMFKVTRVRPADNERVSRVGTGQNAVQSICHIYFTAVLLPCDLLCFAVAATPCPLTTRRKQIELERKCPHALCFFLGSFIVHAS